MAKQNEVLLGTYWELDVNIVRICSQRISLPKTQKKETKSPLSLVIGCNTVNTIFNLDEYPHQNIINWGHLLCLNPCAIGRCFLLDAWMKTWKRFSHFQQMYNALTSKKSLDLGSQCAEPYKWIILERVGAFCLLAWCDELYCRLLHAPESSVMSLYIRFASLTPLWWYYIGSNRLWLECFRMTRFPCAWSRHMQLETLWDHVSRIMIWGVVGGYVSVIDAGAVPWYFVCCACLATWTKE